MRRAYFDNNATTPPSPRVAEAMVQRLGDGFGNPSAIHRRGRNARAAVEEARDAVATLLGSSPSEVVFTRGGSEGVATAILGVCGAGDHLITTGIEHEAGLAAARAVERAGGSVTRLPSDPSGRIDPDGVRRALRPNTRLISVMFANNETGVLQPVEDIGRIAAENDVYFHVDAVQAIGKVPVSVARIRCTLLSLSAHKFHGPRGIGALYVRDGTPLRPLMPGGPQERGRRGGTENVVAIVGLGVAAAEARKDLGDGTAERIRAWRDRVEAAIQETVDGVAINGHGAPRIGNTTNLSFAGIDGMALVVALDRKGIAISAGAACAAGLDTPSPVLMAMGLGEARARSAVRISLGRQNSTDDIDYLLSSLPEAVRQVRCASWPSRPALAEERRRVLVPA